MKVRSSLAWGRTLGNVTWKAKHYDYKYGRIHKQCQNRARLQLTHATGMARVSVQVRRDGSGAARGGSGETALGDKGEQLFLPCRAGAPPRDVINILILTLEDW